MSKDKTAGNASQAPSEEKQARELGLEIEGDMSAEMEAKMREFEKSLEPGLFSGSDNNNIKASQKKQPKTQPSKDDNVENLKKRYADSSKEAKRLKEKVDELQELEQYKPLIQDMKSNPDLINHVRNFYENDGQPTKSLKEELGIDDDFIFDGEEAFTDPKSDSAKVLQASVDRVVQNRIAKVQQEMERKLALKEQEERFIQEHKVAKNELDKMKEWASKHKPTMEELMWLYKRSTGELEENIANDAKKSVMNQMKNVQNRPNRVTQKSGDDNELPIEEQLFKAMTSLNDDVGNAFDF